MSETNLCAPVFPPPVRMPLVAIEKLSQHGRYHHGNSTGEEETWGGRLQQKVQSFTERWLLTAGPGSALDPDRSWNSLRLSSCSVTLILWPQSSLLLFFSFSLQHRTPLTLTSWALCRLYVLSVIDVCGSSDSHWWKLCGCVMSGLFSLSTFQFGISENWCQICVVCHPPPSPFVWQRPCHSAEVCERRAGLYSKCHQTL